MNNVIPFNFHGRSVRVVDIDHDPWFVATDVATILGYAKPRNAIARHCKAGTTAPKQGGGVMTIIPERDVYRLVMRSKLPEAEAFEEWVVGEVLPSIRKTGGYQHPQVPQSFSEALRLAADLEDRNRQLEHERDAAISTKALIGSKREASAMARASAEVRRANELQRQLGREENWKQVKAIPWLSEEFVLGTSMYQQVGKKLKAISDELGLAVDEIPSTQFGTVKSYHIDAINELWRRLQEDGELLAKYRQGRAA